MKSKAMALVLAVAFLAALLAPLPALAEGEGRYKMMQVDFPQKVIPQVLILDTKDGNLWLWERVPVKGKGDYFELSYQGQMKVGDKVGRVVGKGVKSN